MTDLELKAEYKDMLNDKFKKLSPYSYGNRDWESIEEKVKELNQKIDDIPFTDLKEIRIDGEDYLIEFDDFVSKIKTLSSKLVGREAVLQKLREFNSKIFSVSKTIWNKIKFIFSIPGLAFASFVFSMCVILVFSFVINLVFPAGFTDQYSGLTESIIAAIVFVVLKTLLILDSHDRYLEENWILYIIKYAISIGLWWLMFFLIRYTVNETIYQFNYIEWAFFIPFLWLGGIVHEFFRAGIIGYLIVTILPILISLPIILLRELRINIIHKKNIEYKKSENEDNLEDDEYHFDDNINIEVLGNKKDDKE